MEERYTIDDKTKGTEAFLEQEEKASEGSGKRASIVVLNSLISLLEKNIETRDLEGCKYHIVEFERFTNDLKEKGWNIPDEVMDRYNQVRERYLHLI